MMLQVLHKLLALIIALAVLFSTMSFTVDKHVCMGEVTEVSYFEKADGCGMAENACETQDPSGSRIAPSSCCDNIQELIPGNQNEQQALQSLEINKVKYIFTYLYTYANLLEEDEELLLLPESSPPRVDRDIQVLYQTFLI